MRGFRSSAGKLAVVATAAVLLVFVATPAEANTTRYTPGRAGSAWAWPVSGTMRADATTTCDEKTDGYRVRTHVMTVTGATYTTGWAPPAGQGCRYSDFSHQFRWFMVCAEVLGCSPWWDVQS